MGDVDVGASLFSILFSWLVLLLGLVGTPGLVPPEALYCSGPLAFSPSFSPISLLSKGFAVLIFVKPNYLPSEISFFDEQMTGKIKQRNCDET